MNTGQLTQQMISLQKLSIETWRSGMNYLQTQTSDTMNRMMDQLRWLPDENREGLKKWGPFATQQLKRYSTLIDDTFSVYERLLSASQPTSPSKQKPAKQPETGTVKPEEGAKK
jgi:hypothetical protein